MTLPISVIVPCHNDAPTLAAAVESALAADAAQVIIVNDASTDHTSTIAAGLTFVDSRVHYVNSPLPVRGGVCFARNLGIAKANQPLIVPLDADDALKPEGLNALYAGWHTGAFVYSAWYEETLNNGFTPPVITTLEKIAPPIERLNYKNVAQATWLFAKTDWQRVGGYNPTFECGCEDWDFMLSLVESGLMGIRIDTPAYIRHYRANGRAAACMPRKDLILGLLREHHLSVRGVQDHA